MIESAEHRTERLRTHGKRHGGLLQTTPLPLKPPNVRAICDDCEHQIILDGPGEQTCCKLLTGENGQPKPCLYQSLRACPLGKWST